MRELERKLEKIRYLLESIRQELPTVEPIEPGQELPWFCRKSLYTIAEIVELAQIVKDELEKKLGNYPY